ncbi:MAG: DUF4160 domain-containing protein [Spirochaetaceae bacterium]|nr:DUF4160 domain-containing protein [Spirochaetaceae bacterium]
MPLICEFLGIKIFMFWDEHTPPHFHAQYGNDKALVSIEKAVVMKGFLPSRQLKLVLAWCELHTDELLRNWESSKSHGEIHRINPLS